MTRPQGERDDGLELERQVDAVLGAVPPRRAPASLEGRVQRELARRAALPGWRQGFARWPLPARAGFIVACAALVALSVFGGPQPGELSPGHALVGWASGQTHAAANAIAATGGAAGVVVRLVPGEWLRLMLGFGALCYAILFGLGAAAYRTLYLQAHDVG